MPPTYASTMTAPPSPTSVVSCLTSSWPEDPRGRKGPANALAEAWDPQQGWVRQRERVMWKPLQTAGPARVDSLISKADRNDLLERSQRLDDFLAACSDEVCMNEAERSSERDSREARW